MKNSKASLWTILLVGILVGGFFLLRNNQNGISSDQNLFGRKNNTLTDLQKEIVNHFREGRAPALAVMFEDEIALNILDEEDFYTKEEAENILLEFCQKHTPKKFYVKHHGSNQTNTEFYLIGELTTTIQEKFRVYVSNTEEKIKGIEITYQTDLSAVD